MRRFYVLSIFIVSTILFSSGVFVQAQTATNTNDTNNISDPSSSNAPWVTNSLAEYRWIHEVNNSFDPNTFQGSQSDAVETWLFQVNYPNALVDFQDNVMWTNSNGVKTWRALWTLSLTYWSEDGNEMQSTYGIKGFYFGASDTPTSSEYGRTEPPYNVGMHGVFANRTNQDVKFTSFADNSSLLEFNITYTNISIFDSDSYSVNNNFNMTVVFHIFHQNNETRVKVDTILDWNTVDFSGLGAGQPIYVSMHNDYSLQNLNTSTYIYPYGNDTGAFSIFRNGALNVSGFDLGNNYTVVSKNGANSTDNLSSVIQHQENIANGVDSGRMEYYYWTMMNWAEGTTSKIVYDPTISVFTSNQSITRSSGEHTISGYSGLLWGIFGGLIAVMVSIRIRIRRY